MFELISTSSGEKFKNAWVEIAEVLPTRKVKSCLSVCKRRFNPNNYKGRWADAEIDYLIEYVESKGRHWEEVAKELGRTAQNVRDKFKELGEGNHAHRTSTKWNLEETKKLFRLVQKYTGSEFIQEGFAELSSDDLDKNYKPKRISKNNPNFNPDAPLKAVSAFVDFEKAKQCDLSKIPWTKIALKIKTKSKDDCRNRWYKQVFNTIHDNNHFEDSQIKQLLKNIRLQEPEDEKEIDWAAIPNGKSADENRHQWEKLKKMVTGRALKSFEATVSDLVTYFKTHSSSADKKYQLNQTDVDAKPSDPEHKDVNRFTLLELYRSTV